MPYDYSDDPSSYFPEGIPSGAFSGEVLEVRSIDDLYNNQLSIAAEVQRLIINSKGTLASDELKELVALSVQLVNAINRTEETVKALNTYKAFFGVIIEFLRRRTDAVGDDLVAELKAVATEMRQEAAFAAIVGKPG